MKKRRRKLTGGAWAFLLALIGVPLLLILYLVGDAFDSGMDSSTSSNSTDPEPVIIYIAPVKKLF